LSLPTLKASIAQGDVGMLSKAQGLGKKTAERIVVELKDKVLPGCQSPTPPAPGSGSSAPSSETHAPEARFEGSSTLQSYTDAVSALLTLGYKATDADQAVRKAADILGKNSTTEELIRKALGR